jgi:hypothetical protein
MADPRYVAEAATMFYAGDDAGAKQTAAKLAEDLGFDPVDAGPLANARYLETLAAVSRFDCSVATPRAPFAVLGESLAAYAYARRFATAY